MFQQRPGSPGQDQRRRPERKIKKTKDEQILSDWRKLQASDHFYCMCTKYFADGDVHKYFNPYDSPYDSYINFMNVLDNLQRRCGGKPGHGGTSDMSGPEPQSTNPSDLQLAS